MTAPVPQPPPRLRRKVEPVPGSRLETLLSRYREAEAAAAEAKERLDDIKSGIKAELNALASDDPASLPAAFDIPADPRGGWDAFALTWHEGSWGIDTASLKAQDPETYVKWARRGNGYWEFKRKQARGYRR